MLVDIYLASHCDDRQSPLRKETYVSSENANGPMILCWDGSDGAERAIRHAAGLAGAGRPGIVLFAFVPTESARGVLGGLSGPDAPIMSAPEAEVYSNEESGWRARP